MGTHIACDGTWYRDFNILMKGCAFAQSYYLKSKINN